MSDSNVLAAQKYLNSMFGGSEYWMELEENGNTGTLTMQGIIRAFQIHNNVPNPTGNLGPNTISKMKSLPEISKMNASDPSNTNVCLIQCALFCKGYAAGGITGIYYTNGVNAVKAMQEDAGLPVTGTIDWKVWAGLLSLNWFILASKGDEKTRLIQQQLNKDYSNVIGVCACDGVMSRVTASSLLVALQAAEGVETDYIYDLSAQAFGPATTTYFKNNVGILKSGRNDDAVIPFNKIAQYALYLYGFNQQTFDGTYDDAMKAVVEAFQRKHMLVNIGLDEGIGEIGVSTMKSLLTSKGDIDRNAIACDTSTCLNAQQIEDLKNAGYQIIGRYLTGTTGWGETYRSKALTIEEIELLKSSGIKVFPIYQDGGNKLSYFQRYQQGYYDAITAIESAKKLGFYTGTYIYFAVDFDCMEHEANEYIIPYFKQIFEVFSLTETNSKNYKVGIYAPRLICSIVENAGYVLRSFVADMSTGYSGNLGYPLPENCAFDQFAEITFTSTPNFAIDKLGYSGYDPGCSHFDEVVEETLEEKIESARQDYARKFMKSVNAFKKNKAHTINFNVEDEKLVGYYNIGGNFVKIYYGFGHEYKYNENAEILAIEFDETGNFSATFLNTLNTVLGNIEDDICKSVSKNIVENLAISAGFGNISITIEHDITVPNDFVVEYAVFTNDILPEYETSAATYCKLKLVYSIYQTYDDNDNYVPVYSLSPEKIKAMDRNGKMALGLTSVSQLINYMPEVDLNVSVATATVIVITVIAFLLSLMSNYGWLVFLTV